MAEYAIPKFRGASNLKRRLQLAGLLLLLAVALAIVAFQFQSKTYLTSTPARHDSERYSRLWFDVADDLLGANFNNNRLTIERWAGTNPAITWQFDVSPNDLWAFAADNSTVAWISGTTLHWQSTASGAKSSATALGRPSPLALTVLSNGSIAVVFSTAVDRWNIATGQKIDEWQTGLPPADRAAAEGDNVALSSLQDGELRVFALQNSHWIQTQQSLSPEVPERVVIPAPTVAGTMAEGRVRVGGITRSSPGTIRSLGAHLYDVIASGDFEGIYVLAPEGEYYRLAAAAPGSLVAAGENRFAMSATDGTTLFNLGSEVHLTPLGRTVSGIALGVIFLAAMLALAPFLLQAMAISFRYFLRRGPRRLTAPATLAPPPADLVKALAAGDLVMWAGAGLSAQCGFPLRSSFIATLIQSVALEFPQVPHRNLTAMAASGKSEAALNGLVASMEKNRGALLAHFGATFGRFSSLSRSHDILSGMSFRSVVTTNYDVLLENTCEDCAANIVTPATGALHGHFLLKLYGSLAEPASVLLSQSEFQTSLNLPYVEALREVFASRAMLFLGCSLEGILADLATIRMPQDTAQVRFAITGVAGEWEKSADLLSQRYGVRVVPCAEENISEALPAFLDALSRAVDHLRLGAAKPLSAAKTA